MSDCSDVAPQITESWGEIFPTIKVKQGQESNKVEVIYGEGPFKEVMIKSGVLENIGEVMRKFNWPKPVNLHFDHCSEGASWSRTKQRILLCDNYLERFIEQEKQVGNLLPKSE